MDKNGFRADLGRKGLSDEQIDSSIAIGERFEAYLRETPRKAGPGNATARDVNAFSRRMIEEGINTWDNYVALIRYGRFTKNDETQVAALELIDGAEALDTLHRKLGEAIGEERRDRIFAGIELPPLGTPNVDKPALTRIVMERLEADVEPKTCVGILGSGLRYSEDEWFLDAKSKYEEPGGIDAYLKAKGADFIAQLETHRDEGTLFFSQPIDDVVIAYVREHPEVMSGVRRGDLLIEAKIPHQAIEFLAATDPTKKAYYYCHCPWVKSSLADGASEISPTFCNCSAAFHKRPYEVIFGQPLRAEVLETVLRGDPWCRFAIHLPNGTV